MNKEKKLLFYFLGWVLLGIFIFLIGISTTKAETINPTTGFRSQLGTLMSDNTIYWNTSNIGSYGNNLYFGTGPTFSTWGVPGYFRLVTQTDLSTNYSYKISYNMTIYTPYSSSNTWDITKIDTNYNLDTNDDLGYVKESKCSVINTDISNGNTGIYVTKSISCVFTINQSGTNVWLSSGYSCKNPNCSFSSMESLGTIPQDSYMYITSPKLEQFNDNSNIIIDQNQTIIDQNNQTNEELGNLKEQIQESNKETQEVIKDQFNTCHDSYNMFNPNNGNSVNGATISINNATISVTGSNAFSSYNWSIDVSNINTIYLSGEIVSGGYARVYAQRDSVAAINYIDSIGKFNKVIDVSNYDTLTLYLYAKRDSGSLSEPVTSIYKNIMISDKNISYEPYGEKICFNKMDETNNKLDDLNNNLNNDNSSGATNDASNFFSNFTTDTFGLTSIITAPLSLINSLTSSSCSTLRLPIPYLENKYLDLPCMNTIYTSFFGSFFTIYQTITFGIVAYWVIVRIFNQVKDFKNPDHDEIEVLDL